MLPLLVLLGTIAGAWYLLIVRPQKDLQTRHGRLVERLQVGDHVLTVGGIYGRVAAIEGASVVLELAPGLTSRIATDGIARIVHAGEGALPTNATEGTRVVDAAPTPRDALDTDMQHHPHHDQQAPTTQPQPTFVAPQFVAPPQPYAAPSPHPHPHQVQAAPQPVHAPVQLPAPPVPATTTIRARVSDPIPTFEPRPWSDVAPINAPAQQYQPHAPTPAVAMPVYQPFTPAQPQPTHAPQQGYAQQHAYAQPQAYAQPMPAQPVVQPAYLPASGPQHAPATTQYAPAPTHAPMTMAAPVMAPYAPAMHVVPEQAHAAVEPAEAHAAPRRGSRAPQGMGSSLRLDDPSISDTMQRARTERSGLADEYRKLTAPLVDIDPPTHRPQHDVHAHHPQGPMLVGHDPNGVALFATPGSPHAHPHAQYPAPAHPAGTHMPRPVVQVTPGAPDPALRAGAFQRSTPYTADPALQRAPVATREPATA